MKYLSIAVASLALAACSSMPSWMPGGGWTTLIELATIDTGRPDNRALAQSISGAYSGWNSE